MAEMPEKLSRRDWFLTSLQAMFVITLAVLLYPVGLFLRPRRQTSSGALEAVAPFTVKELKAAPQPPFNFGGKPCLVVFTPDGEVRAFNAVCTHIDCTVEFRKDHSDIFCNCHNGVYDLHGRNVSGPPPRPLEVYKVTLRGQSGQEEIVVSRST